MNLNQIIVNLNRALSIGTKSLWIFVPILSALNFYRLIPKNWKLYPIAFEAASNLPILVISQLSKPIIYCLEQALGWFLRL